MSASNHTRAGGVWPFLLLLASPLAAAENFDLETREDLLAFLEEQTEIATKTRINADYVPGIIDVLHGDELLARGARTVWDALGFVPGINPVMDHVGHRRITIRGLGSIGDSWASGYVKVLLNGMPMNSDDRGLADPVYFIPLSQVERIEVMRGPASAIHGEYAMAGLVNVVTRQEGNSVYGFGGSYGEVGAGLNLSGRTGGLQTALSLSLWETDGADILAGPDAYYETPGRPGLAAASYAPGPAREGIAARTAALSMEFEGLQVTAQWTEVQLGDYFGVNFNLPPADDRLVETNQIRGVESRYRFEWPSVDLDVFLGYRNSRVEKDDLFAEVSEVFGVPDGPDFIVDVRFEEARTYGGADLIWKNGRHKLLVGAYRSRTEVREAVQPLNLDPNGQLVEEQQDWEYPVPEGAERRIDSIVLQDEFRYSDGFTVTGSLRYDYYRGIGSAVTPRVAGVWRLSSERSFKAQYGRAFRPPTLTEEHNGPTDIEPTIIDTVEFGYIRKYDSAEWRATAAYSELDDIIVFDQAAQQMDNVASARLASLELEGTWVLGADTRLWGALALTDAETGDGDPFPGASDWLGRLGVRHDWHGVRTDLEYRHVSGYARQAEDTRDELDGYGILDLIVSPPAVGGFVLRAGVANLLDEAVAFPAVLGDAADPSADQLQTYRDDLPRPGRTWWVQVSRGF